MNERTRQGHRVDERGIPGRSRRRAHRVGVQAGTGRGLAALLAAAIVGLGACDGCDPTDGETALGGGPSAGGSGGAVTTNTTTTSRTDEGTSCADAVRLVPSGSYLGVWGTGRIAQDGDHDYFLFEATEGEWLALATNANSSGDPALVDPVLTLWDETGEEQLAYNDDAMAWATADAEIIYRAPYTGTYCLEAWDSLDLGDPSFTYDVGVMPLDSEHVPGLTIDSDPSPTNDTPETAQSPTAADVLMMLLVGMLEPATDEDFYQVRPLAGDADLVLWVAPGGPMGMGGTVTPGDVSIVGPDGETTLARVRGRDTEERVIYLPLPPGVGRLYFQVTRPDESLGSSDAYVLKHFVTEAAGFQPEFDELGNDLPAGAEHAEPGTDDDAKAQVMGALYPGDVDYWSYDALEGDLLEVKCAAQRWGSGLRGMHVTLSSATAPTIPLAEETETDLADLHWSSEFPAEGSQVAIGIMATGSYLLKVDLLTGSQDPVVTSDYYRCTLSLAVP